MTLHVAVVPLPVPACAHPAYRRHARRSSTAASTAVLTGQQVVGARRKRSRRCGRLPARRPRRSTAWRTRSRVTRASPSWRWLPSSRYVAEDALELIDIDYEPLPHVVTVEDALEPGAPQLHATAPSNVRGRIDRARGRPRPAIGRRGRDASRARSASTGVSGAPIETRGVIARWRRGPSTLELWASTQTPHLLRAQLAHCLRMDETDVRVIAPDVGGAFGLKIGVYPEDIIAALLAIDTRRPVKWIEDRTEFFRGAAHAREAVHALTLAADRDGALLALRDRYLIDLGAYHGPLGAAAADQRHARRALSPPRRRDPPTRGAHEQGAHRALTAATGRRSRTTSARCSSIGWRAVLARIPPTSAAATSCEPTSCRSRTSAA